MTSISFRYHRVALALFTSALFLTTSGCGLLLGNVKPVDEKSESYGVLNLSRTNEDWKRLPSNNAENDTAISDVAFQSRKTSSIISLNSACRPAIAASQRNLRSFTDELLRGISDVGNREESELTLPGAQGAPALQTTLQGRLNGEPVALRTVVVRKGECVYDLMYIARPSHFAEQEPDFNQFVGSLTLK